MIRWIGNIALSTNANSILVVGIIASVINIPLPIQGLYKETALLKNMTSWKI
jgi:hypothetical protein